MRARAWLLTSWTGRSLLAVIALKAIVSIVIMMHGGSTGLDVVDRAVNFALIVAAVAVIFRKW